MTDNKQFKEYSIHAHDEGHYQLEDMTRKKHSCVRGVVLYKGTKKACKDWIKRNK
jgi:hypothetical protein